MLSLLITAHISYFIFSAGQWRPVQWRSRTTPTQHPLMGEQVLDRVQRSRAEGCRDASVGPADAEPSGPREVNRGIY